MTELDEKVQLWRNGIMLTLLNGEDSKKMVTEGKAKIINSQAISTD